MNKPTLSQIRFAWVKGSSDTREALEYLFGSELKGNITDRIKLPVDAFRELCIPYNDPRASDCPAELAHGLIAFHRLQVIAKALNEGWTPDWSYDDQPKYFPWFDFQGGRFVFVDVHYPCTDSYLGSRLCFRTRELAEYAGKQFEDLYNQFLSL